MKPRFRYAAHVRIVPLDRIAGRVVLVRWDEDGVTYDVRYITDSEAKTMRCFEDELEPTDA